VPVTHSHNSKAVMSPLQSARSPSRKCKGLAGVALFHPVLPPDEWPLLLQVF
jgi:hypothetical protein